MNIVFPKIVGVLGGMGPYASSSFYKYLLDISGAKKDWEHLHIVLDSNPHIPSRSRHLLYKEKSPVEGMIDSLKKLENYPVDFIAIPCNSACYYLNEIEEHIGIPILNIIEISVKTLSSSYPNCKRCLVLGGRVTFQLRSYKLYLENSGIELILHSEDEQKEIESFIESLKLSNNINDVEKRLSKYINVMANNYNADCVILGCTEFGCISGDRLDVVSIDSSQALGQEIFKRAI